VLALTLQARVADKKFAFKDGELLHYSPRAYHCFCYDNQGKSVELPIFPELVDRLFNVKYCDKKEINILPSPMELNYGKIK
jgi:hypothetical protein